MLKKTAVLFGATGLTGNLVLNILVKDERYEKIRVFTRSELTVNSDKIEVIVTDLENLGSLAEDIKGHDLFCCLGTTIRKAGSKENFRKVDYEFPVKIAEIASKNEVPNFILISSIGADAKSSNFYLKTKGEAEEAIQKSGFKKLVILRPSMLLGKRKEFRLFEEAGKLVMIPLKFILHGRLRKYRAIDAERVAKAMVEFANMTTSKNIFESHEIEHFART